MPAAASRCAAFQRLFVDICLHSLKIILSGIREGRGELAWGSAVILRGADTGGTCVDVVF